MSGHLQNDIEHQSKANKNLDDYFNQIKSKELQCIYSSLRTNNTIRKWSDIKYDVLIGQRAGFKQRIADSPIAPLIPSVIPKNWRLEHFPFSNQREITVDDKAVKNFSEMYSYDELE